MSDPTKTYSLAIPPHAVLQITQNGNGASLQSFGLKAPCTYCGQDLCQRTCDASQAGGLGTDAENAATEAQEEARLQYNAAIDGMESLLVALAGEGVDLDTPALRRAVLSAFESIEQNFPLE